MKIGKYIFIAIIVILFFFTGKVSTFAAVFSDIDSNYRAYTEISYLEDNDIIKGKGDGTFDPNGYLKRSEAAAMLGRALGLDGRQTNTAFRDVSKGSFASGYIQSAFEQEIINGTGNGKFSPNDTVTRGQMAIMIDNAYSLEPTSNDYFLDKPLGGSSFDSINRVAASGISNGIDGWMFEPHGLLTRADFAVFLARAIEPSFRVSAVPINSNIIVIDAGHGGHDNGANGFGLLEKDINLKTALKVEEKLHDAGFKVVMTRSTDEFLELSERVDVAYEANGDAFVSIHSNAFDGSAKGTETYYYSSSVRKESQKLATAIQERMMEMLDMIDRGVKGANFHVLRENLRMPSALVELGFIDNRSDSTKLSSSAWRDKASTAISLGIIDYFKQK